MTLSHSERESRFVIKYINYVIEKLKKLFYEKNNKKTYSIKKIKKQNKKKLIF